MNRLRAIVFFAFLLAAAPAALAAEDFVKLRDHYKSAAAMTLRQETTLEAFGRTLTYSGEWAWDRATKRFHLKIQYQGDEGPFQRVFDGEVLWAYDDDSSTYTRQPVEEGEVPQDTENLDILALLDGSLFEREFELTRSAADGEASWKLVTAHAEDPDFRLTYYFDTSSFKLLSIKNELVSGEEVVPFWRTNYREVVLNPEGFAKGTFEFVPPEGAREVPPEKFLKQDEETPPEPQGDAAPDIESLVGQPAPELVTQDLDGNEVSLSALRGKVVILDFWATWCPPCRKEIPGFIELFKKHEKDGLAMVGISNEDEDTVRKFARETKINYALWLQKGRLAPAYEGIQAIPTTLVIDREGTVRHVHVGFSPREEFAAEITELFGAK